MSQDFLTTQAFAKKAGVSAGTVSKWLRSGKIDGQKKNGKWMISSAELSKVSKSAQSPTQKAPAAKPKPTASKTKAKSKATAQPQSGGTTYSVEAFSEMTYLTEYGVRLWLKTGKLISSTDASGQLGVHADNLDKPHVKRLVR